jgi:hypothetical protein
MSGDGKRGVGHRPQATAPILDSTDPNLSRCQVVRCCWGIADVEAKDEQPIPQAPVTAIAQQVEHAIRNDGGSLVYRVEASAVFLIEE